MSSCDLVLIMPPNNFSDMIAVEENHHSAYYVHYPHLGLLYLASTCEQAGFRVAIIDALVERLSLGDVVRRVAQLNPRFVGITTTTPTLRVAYLLAEQLHKLPQVPEIILGGPHLTADPEILKVFPCRFALRGESDETFPLLLQALAHGGDWASIEGIVFKEGGDFFVSPKSPLPKNLNAIPFPARHLIPNRAYRNPINALSTTAAITVRGCPFDCTFCSRAVRGVLTTGRSIENTLAELKEIEKHHGIQYVTFMDETFTFSKKYVHAFCEAILQAGLTLQWGAQTRADLVDRELLAHMHRAGCRILSCGVESGSERIRKLLHKPAAEAIYHRFVRLCREVGIQTNTFWIFGHPTETLEELEQTLSLCVRLNPTYASFNITNVFVGAPIYDQLLQEGRIHRSIWDAYTLGKSSLPLYVPEQMTADFLRGKIAEGFRRFYLRPAPILHRVRRWKSLREFSHDLKIFKVLATHYMRKKHAA